MLAQVPSSPPRSPAASELIEFMTTGLLVVDGDDRVCFANAAAESLLKASRSKILGRPLATLLDDREALADLCRRSREERGTTILRALPAAPFAQPEHQAVLDVAALPFGTDGVLLEIRDTQLQQRIDRENTLLAQHGIGRAIARQLAHEIKNPLGGIRGAAQLLARRLEGQGLSDYTDVIIRETDRLVALVERMLGPAGPSRRRKANIHRVVDHVHRLLAAEAPAGVSVEADYDPSLPRLSLDEDRLIQAVLNLGRNALQAVGDHGEIVLRTRAISGFTIGETRHALVLRIDVEDNGPGVAEDLQDKIFYPLVTGRRDGTGLGLAVAQDIVGRHGGLIKLMPHEHTLFSVFLPFGSETNPQEAKL